ncbi:MAG: hypothetical protein ABSH42_03495 [Bryobacteraceae bacterium]|jgi:hypothetical protein
MRQLNRLLRGWKLIFAGDLHQAFPGLAIQHGVGVFLCGNPG